VRQLRCFQERKRLRKDTRVTVRMMATASARSPASWAVSTGLPNATVEESETGSAFPLPPCGWIPGDEPGVADGTIAGNRPDALPAPMSELPMSELETPLRFGMGPSGNVVCGEAPADDLAGEGDEAGEADTEVTVTVSAAEGGVHFTEVTMLAVAVSVTEVTEVALEATGICAFRTAGCLSDTELTVHVAVPSPLAQPLVNVGIWLDGCAARATDTLEADPLFTVETCTT